MRRTHEATRVAYEALERLLGLREGEKVLITTDEGGLEENGEIVHALFGVARQIGATPTLVVIPDVKPGAAQSTLPKAVEEGMKDADVSLGITKTTAAPVVHHPLPERLRTEGNLRCLIMAKRSWSALTSDVALETDRDRVFEIGTEVRRTWEAGTEIRVTCDHGSDLTVRIDEHEPHSSGYARDPGDLATITWGETVIGPTVGSTEGTVFIDGQILEYGRPSEPIRMDVERGRVRSITGADPIADKLSALVEEEENADNIGEFAVGINPTARESPLFSEEANIAKKALGSAHIAIGSGLFYGQDVDSSVHIDLVMNSPTIAVDGAIQFDDGELLT